MKTTCGMIVVLSVCAFLPVLARGGPTVTYNIAFTSTDPLSTDPLHHPTFAGSITLEAADIAALSATPTVDSFQAHAHSFSGMAQNATYDASGNLYSIGLSDSLANVFILHGGTASPTLPAWDVDNIQVPLQKDDFGTYVITPAPEPAAGLLLLAGAMLARRRRR